jgi:hypothetical protein
MEHHYSFPTNPISSFDPYQAQIDRYQDQYQADRANPSYNKSYANNDMKEQRISMLLAKLTEKKHDLRMHQAAFQLAGTRVNDAQNAVTGLQCQFNNLSSLRTP